MTNILVTDIAQFHRASANGETRYYPTGNADTRKAAMEFDANSDPVTIKGFGVYDTTLSANYAVEVYPTQSQANEYKSTKGMKAPTSALDEIVPGAAYSTDQAKTPKNSPKKGNTRRR